MSHTRFYTHALQFMLGSDLVRQAYKQQNVYQNMGTINSGLQRAPVCKVHPLFIEKNREKFLEVALILI